MSAASCETKISVAEVSCRAVSSFSTVSTSKPSLGSSKKSKFGFGCHTVVRFRRGRVLAAGEQFQAACQRSSAKPDERQERTGAGFGDAPFQLFADAERRLPNLGSVWS